MAAVVTKYGFQETAKHMTNIDSPVAWTEIALGTGSETEDTDVTSLATEITTDGMDRQSADTVTVASSATANDTCLFEHTWTASGTKAVKETGVVNATAANTGDVLCYATFATAIPMESDDTLKVTWSVQVKAG